MFYLSFISPFYWIRFRHSWDSNCLYCYNSFSFILTFVLIRFPFLRIYYLHTFTHKWYGIRVTESTKGYLRRTASRTAKRQWTAASGVFSRGGRRAWTPAGRWARAAGATGTRRRRRLPSRTTASTTATTLSSRRGRQVNQLSKKCEEEKLKWNRKKNRKKKLNWFDYWFEIWSIWTNV